MRAEGSSEQIWGLKGTLFVGPGSDLHSVLQQLVYRMCSLVGDDSGFIRSTPDLRESLRSGASARLRAEKSQNPAAAAAHQRVDLGQFWSEEQYLSVYSEWNKHIMRRRQRGARSKAHQSNCSLSLDSSSFGCLWGGETLPESDTTHMELQ